MADDLDVTVSNVVSTVTLDSDSQSTRETSSLRARTSRPSMWQGVAIGRYIAISELGAGAMGVVLAAYDPQLDRKVALKLLAPGSDGLSGAQARLQREAQALAKLDSPNVVSVYDVVVHDGQLFVAMEFVAGKTLGAWMAEVSRPRPYRQVLAVFADAGRGLAAAHRAGLVHRDFKPDNVMLGDDGRVRVMDFGLARAALEHDEPDDGHAHEAHEQARLIELTRAGAIMGTPAYMPLEQFEARETDARSDQFSFCVTLYQALYGERPFPGRTFAELQTALEGEQLRPLPRDANVPTWLRKVLLRGLSKDPARRWPSMPALLDALADDPALRRRKWWAAAGLVGLLGGGTWGMLAAVQRDAQVCQTAEQKLDGVWDDSRHAALEQAILGTQLSYAGATWERVERHLDDYASAWVVARTDACEATHTGEQSSELMDLRMACLDDRLLQLRKTVDELERADATTVSNAVDAVLKLPSLDRCADIDALLAEVPPPDDPELATRVQQLDERVFEALAKQSAGRYTDALVITDEVAAEAEQLDYEPLRARVWLCQGRLQRQVGEFVLAETTLKKAFAAATAQRMTTEAMHAAMTLVAVVGQDIGRHEDGRRWAEYAEPLSRAVGTDAARAGYLDDLGMISFVEGDLAGARALFEQSLAIRETAPGLDRRGLGWTLDALGKVAGSQGRLDEAHAYIERAVAISEEMLGPQHPDVAATLCNLGTVECMRGNLDAGRIHNERALAIQEQALEADDFQIGWTLHNLGLIASTQGRNDEARAYYERALAILEKELGRDHPNVADTLLELGNLVAKSGAYAEAQAYYERALAAFQATAPEFPRAAAAHAAIARLAQQQGDLPRARLSFEQALAIDERVYGPEHPDVAYSLAGLGDIAYAEANYEEARKLHERALPILEKALDPKHLERLAACRFTLARVLWDAPAGQGRDRARAHALALLARDGSTEPAQQEVKDWLQTHDGAD